eukprot:m.257808 g.257808  ORF g.257808 m.257808 type:complete len:714 (+) comp54572_c1_seq2:974-3115(+)
MASEFGVEHVPAAKAFTPTFARFSATIGQFFRRKADALEAYSAQLRQLLVETGAALAESDDRDAQLTNTFWAKLFEGTTEESNAVRVLAQKLRADEATFVSLGVHLRNVVDNITSQVETIDTLQEKLSTEFQKQVKALAPYTKNERRAASALAKNNCKATQDTFDRISAKSKLRQNDVVLFSIEATARQKDFQNVRAPYLTEQCEIALTRGLSRLVQNITLLLQESAHTQEAVANLNHGIHEWFSHFEVGSYLSAWVQRRKPPPSTSGHADLTFQLPNSTAAPQLIVAPETAPALAARMTKLDTQLEDLLDRVGGCSQPRRPLLLHWEASRERHDFKPEASVFIELLKVDEKIFLAQSDLHAVQSCRQAFPEAAITQALAQLPAVSVGTSVGAHVGSAASHAKRLAEEAQALSPGRRQPSTLPPPSTQPPPSGPPAPPGSAPPKLPSQQSASALVPAASAQLIDTTPPGIAPPVLQLPGAATSVSQTDEVESEDDFDEFEQVSATQAIRMSFIMDDVNPINLSELEATVGRASVRRVTPFKSRFSRADPADSRATLASSAPSIPRSASRLSRQASIPVSSLRPRPSVRHTRPGLSLTAVVLFPHATTDPEELNITPGDLVSNIQQTDVDWWSGTCNGREGFFPSSYVQLVFGPPQHIGQALFDYASDEAGHLTFSAGEIICQIEADVNGWSSGYVRSRRGYFPTTYVDMTFVK